MNFPFWHHELEHINPVSSNSKQGMFFSQFNWYIVTFFFRCKGFIKGNFVCLLGHPKIKELCAVLVVLLPKHYALKHSDDLDFSHSTLVKL